MMDDYWLDEGIECDKGHFVSDEALEGHVAMLSSEGAGKHNGRVKCPAYKCEEEFNPYVNINLIFMLFNSKIMFFKNIIF